MLFRYKVIDKNNNELEGEIDAVSQDVALSSLQSRGFIVSDIRSADQKDLLHMEFSFFNGVKQKDVVIMSRQISTLFEAQVSALRIFRLLGEEIENPKLQQIMTAVADDLQGGSSISKALAKHPEAFSNFYVNMVRAGEETGRLDETFLFLADYLDRTYELTSKAKNALVYPAFVIFTFFAVMYLMLTMVIPQLATIMDESGIEPPIYTKIVLGLSNLATNYGFIFIILAAICGGALFWYQRTPQGAYAIDNFKLQAPFFKILFKKLYLSRIADNMSTMLSSGISMVRSIEISADVVGNRVYEEILTEALSEIKNGASVSSALGKYPEIPRVMTQMIKVGEETGELGAILKTLSNFYRREVESAIDTLIGLIEPAMIIMLGVGVGGLLASVLIPIYNITLSIS